MSLSLFFFDYARWHYQEGPGAIVHIWFTMLQYIEQTFAIRLHARSLFVPWHRVQEKTERKFDIEEWAANTLVNIVSRLLGFSFRAFLILAGLLLCFMHCLILPVILLIWFFIPIVVSGLILGGLTLILISYGHSL